MAQSELDLQKIASKLVGGKPLAFKLYDSGVLVVIGPDGRKFSFSQEEWQSPRSVSGVGHKVPEASAERESSAESKKDPSLPKKPQQQSKSPQSAIPAPTAPQKQPRGRPATKSPKRQRSGAKSPKRQRSGAKSPKRQRSGKASKK